MARSRPRPTPRNYPPRGKRNAARPLGSSSSSSSSRQSQILVRYSFGIAIVVYAASMFVWQHHHLSARSSGAYDNDAALLASRKDAFINNGRSRYYRTAAAAGNDSNFVLNYRPARLILQNPKLPEWVKQYSRWHKEQLQTYVDAKRANVTHTATKFVICRCLYRDICGGASDRLQDMPYNLMLANRTRRVLLLKWEKPAPLENFLVPPNADDGGIDWRINDELLGMLESEGVFNWALKGKDEDDRLKIVSYVRRDSAAPMFRNYEARTVGHKIYHEIFRLLFTPSKALAEEVRKTMTSLSLVPKQYSSVHLRVKYPTNKGIDERTFKYEEYKDQIVGWANNAVNCAAELHPNSTIYVCADSNDTVGYLLEESRFATQHADAVRRDERPLVTLAARDYSDENPHVAFSGGREAEGFMNVFVDMMIMGMGKCVAHGVGGYGRLGAALSGGECVMAHRGRHSKVCSDVLAKIQTGVDS